MYIHLKLRDLFTLKTIVTVCRTRINSLCVNEMSQYRSFVFADGRPYFRPIFTTIVVFHFSQTDLVSSRQELLYFHTLSHACLCIVETQLADLAGRRDARK